MSEAGKKYDEGKEPFNLIPMDVLNEVAKVLGKGAIKYGPNNWQKLEDAEERYYAAAQRHLRDYRNGEEFDKDSGLPHISHALTNVIFLAWLYLHKEEAKKETQLNEPCLNYTLKEYGIPPSRGTVLSSGVDVYSPSDYLVEPWGSVLIPIGICFDIPKGYDLSLYNKSSVCTKKNLVKGAELIDNDYTGEVHVHLFNFSDEPVNILRGDKIAQFVLRPVSVSELAEVLFLRVTERGAKGFGSAGDKYE